MASLFSRRPVPCVTSGRKSTIAGSDVAPPSLCSPSLDEGGRCAPAVSFRYWLVDQKNKLSARCATCIAFPFRRLSLLSYVKDSHHASVGDADRETRETEANVLVRFSLRRRPTSLLWCTTGSLGLDVARSHHMMYKNNIVPASHVILIVKTRVSRMNSLLFSHQSPTQPYYVSRRSVS